VARADQPLWWQQGVIYQIYPRSFKDSNGDGIGDLAGILQQLDYLVWLGVDALWISPFYPSPMADFGYDVMDYTGVDSLFGTLADFDVLLAEAHRRDLKIIIDFVPNHSSDEHPWFIESRSSRQSPKRDWYVWADPKPDGSPPNNWLSVWGESAWTLDEITGQYYLHSFDVKQPDLNWRNPAVQAAMLDVLRFWLERGVDGFRMDAVLFMMKDPLLRDNPRNTEAVQAFHKFMGSYDSLLHIYDNAHPDVHDVFREMRMLLDTYSAEQPRVSIGEMHVYDWPKWASYYGETLDELHMPFNFGMLKVAWQGRAVREMVDAIEAVAPPGGWPNYVLGNHDEPRIATRVGQAGARLAMLLLLTLRGTPTLYNGDEIGMSDGAIPSDEIHDPLGLRYPELGRDPERTPMHWDASPNAGFCPPGVKPWLPIAANYQQINVVSEREEYSSVLSLTHRLLALRRVTPALNRGRYQSLHNVPDACFVYLRQDGAQRRLMALNFSAEPQTLTLPDLGSAQVILSTCLDREGAADLTTFALRAHEGCIIALDHQEEQTSAL
jgi:alpha-glucosidase